MRLALILVHFHTPELARRCVETLEVECRRMGLEPGVDVELRLVDNGSTPEEAKILAELPVSLFRPRENLGFAGGVNLGVDAGPAECYAVLNPDVEVLPGCLERLLEALDAGAAVAGPRFYLDGDRRFLIPPTEERTRSAELRAVLAARGEPWTRWARRRWRRHARRHWRAQEPLTSPSLSGALLVFPRATWETLGPFDDGFQLYFEEDDWLRRVEQAGLTAVHVPGAGAVHRYGRSTTLQPAAAGWFAQSRARYRRRWYGGTFSRLLDALEPGPELRLPPPPPLGQPDGPPILELEEPLEEALWLELSPSPLGFPAAAERLPAGYGGPWAPPTDWWRSAEAGVWTLRLVSEASGERWAASFQIPARTSETPDSR